MGGMFDCGRTVGDFVQLRAALMWLTVAWKTKGTAGEKAMQLWPQWQTPNHWNLLALCGLTTPQSRLCIIMWGELLMCYCHAQATCAQQFVSLSPQAHATAHRVALFYVAESQSSAAYLVEWDAWREAGVSHSLVTLLHEDAGLLATTSCSPAYL